MCLRQVAAFDLFDLDPLAITRYTKHKGSHNSPLMAGSSDRPRSSSRVPSVSVRARRPLPGRRATPDNVGNAG